MYKRICLVCNEEFNSKTPQHNICYKVHLKECVICGTKFEIKISNRNKKTCSRSCNTKLGMQNRTQKAYCLFCGEEFNKRTKTHKYCKPEHLAHCPICDKEKLYSNDYIEKQEDKLIASRTCSDKCRNELRKENSLKKYGVENPMQSKEVQDKMKATNLERYGTENVFASDYGKQKIKETNLRKYGVENTLQEGSPIREDIKKKNLEKFGVEYPLQSKEIQNKIEETNLEKLGVRRPFESQEVQERIIQSNLENYGVKSTLELEEVKEKSKETMLRRNREMQEQGYIPVTDILIEYGSGWYQQKIVPIEHYNSRACVHKDYIPTIKEYSESNPFKSNFEKEIGDFVESLGVDIQRNSRSLISPLEIDIYVPEKDLAIECNGTYWHSTNVGTLKSYHLSKTMLCLEKGIRLIHINEWEWIYKRDIIKSLIKSALGIFQRRIYARNCAVKELSTKEAKEFLEINHLQGYVNSSIKLGLFYESELVQVITLGKSRFKKNEFELLRMTTLLDTQVIGGFSKLISHIPEEITEIMSYVDRSKFTGTGYINSGWELIDITSPGYSYYKDSEKLNRIATQKHKLADLLGKENFDSNLTEAENMMINGYCQVYDCGNLKVKLIRD